MHASKLAVLIPLFTLAGCWPYLGGPYEDYVDGEGTEDPDTSDRDTSDRDTSDRDTSDPDTDDPDTATPGDGPTLFGVFSSFQFVGGYWGDDPAGFALQSAFIAAAEPGLGWTYASTFAAIGECSGGSTIGSEINELGIDVGLPSSLTIGPSAHTVALQTWEGDSVGRTGNNSGSTTLPVNVAVTINTTIDDGSVNGTLTRTPSDFTWTDPPVDGDQMVLLPREPFNVLWSGAGNDTIIATILYQDANFETLSGGVCTIGTDGFGIDPAVGPDEAEFIELRLMRIREYSGTIPGTAGVESVVAGALEKRGYVALQPVDAE